MGAPQTQCHAGRRALREYTVNASVPVPQPEPPPMPAGAAANDLAVAANAPVATSAGARS